MRTYLKNVLQLVKPYRFRFALGLLCGFLSGALTFTLPLSLMVAAKTVFTQGPAASTNSTLAVASKTGTNQSPALAEQSQEKQKNSGNTMQVPGKAGKSVDKLVKWFRDPEHPSRFRVALAIALIPGFMLVRGVFMYLNIYMLSWVGIRATNDLRVKLFSHLIHMPMQFFSKTSTGDLMARMEGAVAVNNTINGSFAIMIREPIAVISLVGTLVSWQPMLSLATLVIFPVCLVPVVIYGRKLRRTQSGVHLKFANVSKTMHEAFTSARVIKAYNLEPLVVEQFRSAGNSVVSFFMRSVRASELPGPLIEFIGAVGVSLIFAYFAFLSKENGDISEMFAFFMAVFGLYAPVKNLSRLHSQITLAQTSLNPIYELLAIKTTLPEPANPKPLKAQNAPIRFEHVTFSYGERTVLHNINLTIKPGQLVALVGRTGSGKTSLANLLLRFYDPHKGAVLIGETDIRSVTSKDLRASIAVVTQQTILFNESIGYNIGLGRPGATQAEIEEAAKHAYAHDFIMEKPQGYETNAGEKGANVSGGQGQRLAIARAILKNAPILILDEATSSLDTEAERIVQAALEELMKGRTTICIAHRLSTIQRADLIVVLNEGRIVEQGDHASLMKRGGIYHKLFSLQFESAPA